jgi:hypothetical protein
MFGFFYCGEIVGSVINLRPVIACELLPICHEQKTRDLGSLKTFFFFVIRIFN